MTFTERSRDDEGAVLYDGSRDMYLRLATHGGTAQWRLAKDNGWTDWMAVVPQD